MDSPARIRCFPPALLLCVVAALGCSRGEEEPRRDGSAGGVAAIDVSEVRLQGRERSATEEAALLVEIGSDDWASEVLAQRAQEQLDVLAARLTDGGPVEALVAPAFACQALRPESLAPRRAAGTVEVLRPEALPSAAPGGTGAHAGAAGLRAALDELTAAFPADGETLVELVPFGIELADEHFDTRVWYRAGRRGAARGVQQTADWRCRWTRGSGDEPPRLSWIGLERYEELAVDAPGGRLFADVTASAFEGVDSYAAQQLPGIDDWLLRISRVVNMSIGGHHGIAVGDVDGDGRDDLYVCDAGGLPNRLYVQEEDGTLRDASADSGADWLEYSASALLVDLDGDGDQDLALATRPKLVFMENDGSGRFTERLRLDAPLDPMSISSADHDLDGDLDVYVCAYNRRPDGETPAAPVPYHDAENGDANLLLRNDGGFAFTDVTGEVGLDQNNSRYSFAAVWEDCDEDGDVDLYVANDFGRNNLYRNDGGRFVDVAGPAGVEDIASGMGAAWGDFDRDGRMDIYVSNMFQPAGRRVTLQPRYLREPAGGAAMELARMAVGNTLYRSAGDGSYQDVGQRAGANRAGWAWATRFGDLDDDGWEDLVVVNGYFSMPERAGIDSFFWRQVVSRSPVTSYTEEELDHYVAAWRASVRQVARERSFAGWERDAAFLNLGGGPELDGAFADASFVTGLDLRDDGRALAMTDWDRDGDLDVWLHNRTGPRLRLMHNQGAPQDRGHASLALRLRGTESNRDGIGARVVVELEGGARLVRGLQAGDGFLSQSSKWLHLGLGSAPRVARVAVRWPGGEEESFSGVEPGGRYVLVEGSGVAAPDDTPPATEVLAPAPQPAPPVERTTRSYLASRLPLPILRYHTLSGTTRRVEVEGRPLFLYLWASWWEPCVDELRELTRGADRLREAGLDVLAIAVDGLGAPRDPAGRSADPDDARRALEELGFPFEAGLAGPELVDKLDMCTELLYELSPDFGVPLGLLIDRDGELAVCYRGRARVATLLADLELLDVESERRQDLSAPFPGRWFGAGGGLDLPRVASWFMERYPEDAVRFLERLPEGAGGAVPQLLLAQSLVEEGRPADALAAYDRAIAADAGSLDAWIGRGRVQLALERPEDALATFAQALELAPGRADLHHHRARAYQQADRPDDAIAEYEAALAIRPDLVETRNNLGNLLKARGRVDEAIVHYLAALEADPSMAVAHYNLAETYRAQRELEKAAASYERAIAAGPELYQPELQLGVTLIELGRTPDALPHLERAAELTSQRDLLVLQKLAEAYRASGRTEDAVATAGRAYDAAVASGDQRAAQSIQAWMSALGGGR